MSILRLKLILGACTAMLAATILAPTPVMAGEAAELFDNKCPVCHVMNLRELKRKKGPTLIERGEPAQEPTGEQNSVSTPAMCLSCHDGYVMDSRSLFANRHMGHRVGMVPSEKIAVPMFDDEPVFPMNADGNMYCGTCHSGHAGEGEAANAPAFLRVNPTDGNLCSACHADNAGIVGSPHVRRAGKNKDYEKRGTCNKCHVPHNARGPALWAKEPGEAEDPISGTCRSCHSDDPKHASHPATVMAWSQEVRQGLRRNSEVEMPVFDEAGRHARTGRIGCPTCHNPHKHRAEGRPEHLEGKYLRLADTTELLCADCHGEDAIVKYQFFHSEVAR